MTQSDPTRDWIDDLPGITQIMDVTFGELMVPISAIRERFAALPTTPTPSLDVEQLANATARVVGHAGALDWHREWAEKVAREYAALAYTEPDGHALNPDHIEARAALEGAPHDPK